MLCSNVGLKLYQLRIGRIIDSSSSGLPYPDQIFPDSAQYGSDVIQPKPKTLHVQTSYFCAPNLER